MTYRKQVLGVLLLLVISIFSTTSSSAQTDPTKPNILLIIADDLGADATPGFATNPQMPNTPHLDALRASGVSFTNAWASTKCAPTRAAIMTGKFGNKSGVMDIPANLSPDHSSVFDELSTLTSDAYSSAVIGKWHIGDSYTYSHITDLGIDHYVGNFYSNLPDYENWPRVENGVESTETEYATTHFTNEAASWINDQNQPWMMWLAHAAPHTPFHVPPDSMHTQGTPPNNQRQFLAMIESLDFEVGRLMDSIPPAVLNNTLIIFVGDNGTSKGVIQGHPGTHAKGTLYQGGLHIPFIVSGAGVTRAGDTEPALVNVVDIYATVLEAAGASLPGGKYNSLSFHHLLSGTTGDKRPYNFTETQGSGEGDGWTIRDDQYKLIHFHDGRIEFYDLSTDQYEQMDISGSLSPAQQVIFDAMLEEGYVMRYGWSCQDLIQNGLETTIDDCAVTCPETYFTNRDNTNCCVTPVEPSIYNETIIGDVREISTNNFPDHDYCFGPANEPSPLYYNFKLDATPSLAGKCTPITSAGNRPQIYYGVALNGVLMAPAPAQPFIFENQETGEFVWDWIFEPTNNIGVGPNWVRLDCASAHTGGQGYHYHGNPYEYVEQIQPGISTTNTPPAGPIQIGWAGDGYPILYRFAPDGTGGLALLQPGYTLKTGERPGDGIYAPCGPYNGKYTNDYEFTDSGDLDECNGIERSVSLTTPSGPQTFDYFYVVTDSFPQIGRCHKGTTDTTFFNSNQGAVLPLDLLGFTAKYNDHDRSADLKWMTTSEENVSHFSVERSYDARRFEEIGRVEALNIFDNTQTYDFKDLNLRDGYQYYRLKMIDRDGTYSYSQIKSVRMTASDLDAGLVVHPNPVISDFKISFNAIAGAEYSIEIINQGGKQVTMPSTVQYDSEGRVTGALTLEGLPAGVYFLRLSTGNKSRVRKVIKIGD